MLVSQEGRYSQSIETESIDIELGLKAISEGNKEWAKAIIHTQNRISALDPHKKIKIEDEAGKALFEKIIEKKADPLFIKALLCLGLDIEITDQDSKNLLQQAIVKCHLRAAEFLIDHGANINQKDNDGMTPLMGAIEVMPEIVEHLIEKGVDVKAKNNMNSTVFQVAVYSRRYNLIYLLAKELAKTNEDYKEIADKVSFIRSRIDLNAISEEDFIFFDK